MLTVNDLRFSIDGTSILRGITLNVTSGETVGVIGPNGSGKTTLFNCLSGFNVPTKGTISFKEADITHVEAHKRALLGIGRVFQNFGIFREMTLLENIIIALENKAGGKKSLLPWSKNHKENIRNALDSLKEVKLDHLASVRAEKLSGGQMRLLEIARSIAFGAELLLLDEPTAGVSPKMKDEVAAQIERLQHLNRTVLIIEHDLNFIQKFCNRIIVLDQGTVVLDGTPDEVRSNKRLQEIYFGAF
jgi:branched-chain amino acid transport system ATP-binding protein